MIIARNVWGGPAAPFGSRMNGPATSVTVHHPYPHKLPADALMTQEMREVKKIHDFHDTKWAGIGYNFIIAQSGAIYEGRGFGRVGAHAGTTQGNETSIGVAFLLDGYKDEPTMAAAKAFEALRAEGVRDGFLTRAHTIKLHRDWKSTDCPGPVLARWALRQASATPVPRLLKYGLKGDDVKAIQRRLGVQPVSGYFGRVTEAAVRNFQRKNGLEADGIVGEKTRRALSGL